MRKSSPETARKPIAGPDAGRGGTLDALRFVAAMVIVLYHYGDTAPQTLKSLHPVFERGYLATDFFLILSGYVLGRAYGRQVLEGMVGTGAFLARRAARIWPGHIAVLAGFVVVVAGATAIGAQINHPEHYRLADLAPQALLIQAWGWPSQAGWNMPTWSLSALLVCYAAFPWLWRVASRLGGAAALAAGLLAVMVGDLATRAAFDHVIYDLPFHLGVVRAAPLFFLGLTIARAVESGLLGAGRARELVIVAGVWFVGLQSMGRLDVASIAAIAAGVLACGSMPVARPSRLVEQGAKLSFALFITHGLTGMVWFGALNQFDLPVAAQWAGWAASFPIALVAAALFHRIVDTPLQAAVAPLLRRRPAPRPATARSA